MARMVTYLRPNHRAGAIVRGRQPKLRQSHRRLTDAISLTFKQVQKYENRTNPVDAARLAALSQGLNVPPQWFFHHLGDNDTVKAPTLPADIDETDELARRETLTLIRAFNRIKDPEKRLRLVDLVQAVGDAECEDLGVLDA